MIAEQDEEVEWFGFLDCNGEQAELLKQFLSKADKLLKKWIAKHPDMKNYPPIFWDQSDKCWAWVDLTDHQVEVFKNMVLTQMGRHYAQRGLSH